MRDSTEKAAVQEAIALLTYYGFDLAGEAAELFVERALKQVRADWLRLAILEALYQGRYKGISVQQLLELWQRRGMPVQHFNGEFERLMCGSLPGVVQPEEEIPEAQVIEMEEEAGGRDMRLHDPINPFTPSEVRSPFQEKLRHLAQPESDEDTLN
ncbi:hypothetical protein [Sodalinema gerasimenkoae]|uniref:hypothetical protein n=1 Tax=Sodalinema gerasimenkoae TaxID=2862348 RepID=UPI00135AE4FA|nr:hypothetical protein [Sodalinema gerasimenkoae]